jgi:hypothetical protein
MRGLIVGALPTVRLIDQSGSYLDQTRGICDDSDERAEVDRSTCERIRTMAWSRAQHISCH